LPSVLPPPPSLPAACANCLQITFPSIPGANFIQMAIQQFRSLEGMLRIDFGLTSIIINPLNQMRILLDHVALEARILLAEAHLPGMPQIQMPHLQFGMPQMPNLGAEVATLEQLGIAIVQGLEAEGMRYLFPPGGLLFSWEMWTSIQLKIPVLTRLIGVFGERTCVCNCSGVHPPAAMFEIPPGYTVIPPSPPVQVPPVQVPLASQGQMPSAPQVQMPTAPPVQVPTAPQVQVPSASQVQMPTAPQVQVPPAQQFQMPPAPQPPAPQIQIPPAPQAPLAPQVQIPPVPKIG
jgi:hypothetical protein